MCDLDVTPANEPLLRRKVTEALEHGKGVLHVLAPDAPRPDVGTPVHAVLDWERRYKHMRMHTALHVMSAVIKGNVTGGQVNADKSRLDFNLEGDVPTKEWVTEEINKILNDKEFAESLQTLGVDPAPGTTEQLRDWVSSETKKWGDLATKAGMQKE